MIVMSVSLSSDELESVLLLPKFALYLVEFPQQYISLKCFILCLRSK